MPRIAFTVESGNVFSLINESNESFLHLRRGSKLNFYLSVTNWRDRNEFFSFSFFLELLALRKTNLRYFPRLLNFGVVFVCLSLFFNISFLLCLLMLQLHSHSDTVVNFWKSTRIIPTVLSSFYGIDQ